MSRPRPSLRRGALAAAITGAMAGPASAQVLPTASVAASAPWLQAGSAIRDGDWIEARRLADATDHPVAAKLVRWLDWMRDDSLADPAEIAAFLDTNPGWPGASRLQRRMEERLDPLPPDAVLIRWFDRRPPETTSGRVAYAAALLRAGRAEDGDAVLRRAWVEASLRPDDEQEFLSRFAAALRPVDHAERLDRLIWANEISGAQRMLPLVDASTRRVAEMRLRLRAGRGPEGLAELTDAERSDPALLYELVRHYRRVEDDAAAERILTAQIGRAHV